ncbi:hypothetical protein HF313_16620 [Massilia atriviolacea]|uniref:Uncharacterized protein n=1 Tax=Massilia atriviolacea TaxID=2495579 RepID=A0A430HU94_9BURK|nr:hypothetical protein [Massilia atriviolacea]RSZ61070.1 hypothetical protein EJB06_02790 [Massilia atriviolacea]
MTIEVRTGAPAPARDDDKPQPVRRAPPPRYAPRPAPKAPPPPSPAPPPPRPRPRDTQAARQAEYLRRERVRREQAEADPRTPLIDSFVDTVVAPPGHQHGDADDGEGCAGVGAAGGVGVGMGVGASASSDAGVEAALLGLQEQQGIFELELPGGQSLGVVVHTAPGSVQFLLSAGDGDLEQRLHQNKMELERRLQRRMQKDVRIAVL